MDPTLFKDQKTGELLPIKVLEKTDYSFIPNPLPPAWEFPVALWPKLAKAKEVLGQLDGIGRTLPDPQLILSPLTRNEAVASSRIEGTYATAQELMLFELNPREPKSEGDQVNSWLEVFNYSEALNEGVAQLRTMPFCLRLTKLMHEKLLNGVRQHYTSPGEFREHQVAIGSDRRYIPPPSTHLTECLDALEKYINTEESPYDPLVRAYLVHYQFEAIHPFADGNGRIGRVLLSLMIAKWCGLKEPWLYMSPFFERYKDEYIRNMFQISTEGAWERWIDFCITGTIRQAEDAIRRCEKLVVLREEMLKRPKRSTVRSDRIILGLFLNPIVRTAQISREYEVSYPTAKDDVDRLVAANILRPLPGDGPKAWYAADIYAAAYGPPDDNL